MKDEVRKIFHSYCYRCCYFESNSGVCTRIHENIKTYPKKFFAKCNREYFRLDQDKASMLEMKSSAANKDSDTDSWEPLDDPLYHEQTFIGYGKIVSVLGWGSIFIGVFLLIGFLFNNGDINYGGVLPLLWLLSGIGMVVSGQLVLCFVSIERNTRKTLEFLKKFKNQVVRNGC
jgi:hypothetical protein